MKIKTKTLAIIIPFLLIIPGCYTHFGPPPPGSGNITTRYFGNSYERRCFHVHDRFGRPTVRCFTLRTTPGWYGVNPYPGNYWNYYYRYYNRCPPYTYFDAGCDCCRRSSQARPYISGPQTTPPSRRPQRGYGVPQAGEDENGNKSLSNDNTEQIPQTTPSSPQHQSREYGVPRTPDNAQTPESQGEGGLSKEQGKSGQKASPPPVRSGQQQQKKSFEKRNRTSRSYGVPRDNGRDSVSGSGGNGG